MLNMTLAHLMRKVFIPAYSAFVLSQLEYYIQARSPSLCGDVTKIEGLQRAATKLVSNLRNSSYVERLNSLDLLSLERRQVRSDLFLICKMLNRLTKLRANRFFATWPPGLEEAIMLLVCFSV